MIVCQPPKTFKHPEENAFRLAFHLLGDVGIVDPLSRLVFGGQDELAAVKPIGSVIQGLEIAVGESQEPTDIQP